MKTYMPLNGLRWSRNSGSANCDMPQSAVFGRPGGVETLIASVIVMLIFIPIIKLAERYCPYLMGKYRIN